MDAADTADQPAWSSFSNFLQASARVLCLVGAGLSAPSGLATWRGANGLWNDINLRELASPQKFREDPVTVWRFYGERLLETLAAQPNAAHHALASLARRHAAWLTVNQNVDGLLEQTAHPISMLRSIHGQLRIVRCTACDYKIEITRPHDIPFLQLLSKPGDESRALGLSDLPHCPYCSKLLRPGVVWFGEKLAAGAPDSIDEWISEGPIDLVIAAGTSLQVFPAAEWVYIAQAHGAALAVIDLDDHLPNENLEVDWFFKGNIEVTLPEVVNMMSI
ncbi:unnamed protein product [Periconia digitata]|uniref:Deacetylase sirtuin-type domain-containing protein n=1 Tax=Periconia digitata TaxID=1303443 RepID=A0A9W4UCI2_9PLEO|nr:unnamed protein product [Periconia digitata]